MSVSDLNFILSLGSILMLVGSAGLLVLYFLRNRSPFFQELTKTVEDWAFVKVLGIATFGSIMTLVYSDILGFEPCALCWWQRIFLYPQVIMLGLAWWKRDVSIATYSIALSVVGFGFALYHHFLQMFPGSLPCPATGVSCAQRTIFEFGFVTFPMMAVALFALMIVLMMFVRRAHRERNA